VASRVNRLAQDFVVELVLPSDAAKALAGVTVAWQVLDGGGSLSVASASTDADGRAHARLTLGPAAGSNRVRASVTGGEPVLFDATAIAADDNMIEIVSGNGQALPTQSASAPLVVVVHDAGGQPVSGAHVHWSGDNASVQATESITGADGRASNIARIVLPGAATVSATLDDSDASVDFVINGGIVNIGGLDPTEEAIARAIDIFCPELVAASTLTPAQLDLRTRCLELVDNAGDRPDDVRNALDQLRQDVAMGQSNAAYAAVGAQFDNLKTRIAALRAGSSGMDLGGLAVATASGVLPLSLLPADPADTGGAEVGADFSRWGFFASGQIGRGSQDGDTATPQYDFDSTGLTAGVDYRVSDQVIFGVSAGWNKQDTELAQGRGNIDTSGWSLSAYSTWYRDNAWYFDGVLTFGSNDYDLDRRIRYAIPGAGGSTTEIDQLAVASTGGDQRSLAVSFGRDFQKGAWSLGPYLRGTYTSIDFDAYSETTDASLPGAGLGLAVDSRELESQTAVLGGRASYALSRDWGILMPHVQLEWEHEFQDDPDSLVARFLHDPTHTAIRTDGEALDTDYYNLGLGLSALFPGGKSAFFYYERLIGASGQSQDNLSLGVRIEF
jgi:outer membrane autotransporter protein